MSLLLAGCGGDPSPATFRSETEAACADEVAGDLFIEEEAAVDMLLTTRRVDGDLRLANFSLAALDGLTCLSEVTGRFSISGVTGLVDLHDLSRLESVGGLEVTENPQLRSLDGLDALTAVDAADGANDIEIRGNEVLEDISALGGLTGQTLDGLVIAENPLLTTLDGLGGILQAAEVVVAGNDSLSGIELTSLSTVANLRVVNNGALVALSGLGSLTDVERLEVEGNDSLVTLAGIDSIQAVGGQPVGVVLFQNEALTNVEALSNASFGGVRVVMRENPSLTQSAVSSFVEDLLMNGFVGEVVQDAY